MLKQFKIQEEVYSLQKNSHKIEAITQEYEEQKIRQDQHYKNNQQYNQKLQQTKIEVTLQDKTIPLQESANQDQTKPLDISSLDLQLQLNQFELEQIMTNGDSINNFHTSHNITNTTSNPQIEHGPSSEVITQTPANPNRQINKLSNQNSHRSRSVFKKNRKIRTTITKSKLAQMNRIFAEYTSHKEQGKNPKFNLKQIGGQLQLGYSTILHKFRQFRATKRVKGGALIASLQKKRKYKKSLQIQQIIEMALSQRPFFTAVQLSKYISGRYQRCFSRSIISRHLGEMGYSYKNLKTTPIQKNKPKYKQVRCLYAFILQQALRQQPLVVYIDEMACNLNNFFKRKNEGKEVKKADSVRQDEDYVSVLVAASSENIIFHRQKPGFFTRRDFIHSLVTLRQKVGSVPLVLLTDLNRIHREGEDEEESDVQSTLRQLNILRLFLPPSSPQLNPLQSLFVNVKNKVSKKQIHSSQQLLNELSRYMLELQSQNIEVHFKDLPMWLQKSKNRDNF